MHQTAESRANATTPIQPLRSVGTGLDDSAGTIGVGEVVENASSTVNVKKVSFASKDSEALEASVLPKPSSTFFAYRLPMPSLVEGTQTKDIVSVSLGEIGQTQEIRENGGHEWRRRGNRGHCP